MPRVSLLNVLPVAALAVIASCQASRSPSVSPAPASTARPTLAQVYFWRANPGRLADYNAYIRDVAEPIDENARQHGAFISVTTYVARDTATGWTHMRVFLLRDSAQLAVLGAALDSAGMRLQPDSTKRRERSQYGATLRDFVGSAILDVLP